MFGENSQMSQNLQDDDKEVLKALQSIPNIGPASSRDLVLLGIRKVEDLRTRDPDQMYEELCVRTGAKQDPCVWDTFASAVYFAQTGERKKWWEFTAIRKARDRT